MARIRFCAGTAYAEGMRSNDGKPANHAAKSWNTPRLIVEPFLGGCATILATGQSCSIGDTRRVKETACVDLAPLHLYHRRIHGDRCT